ncbi:MAG: cation-efflux pump [candidate division WOR-3 bacterium]
MTRSALLAMTREKSRVALSSVIAAIFLTVLKLVVGILTRSLGIIAEALHSGLDLLAALVTLVAVRTSDRPADDRHNYGYGKVESLSALIESGLLVVTAGWIGYEAIGRLIAYSRHQGPEVRVNALALGVMVVSIAVDFTRSRALSRVARKYGSQALEADALHFSTDIYGSLAVIAGLASVRWLGFQAGDPLVALGVAGFVIFSAVRLTIRAVQVLLDRAQSADLELVKQCLAAARDVDGYRRLRIRRAGNKAFVDLTINVKPDLALERAHEVTEEVEQEIARRIPNSDVVIHVEPTVFGASIAVPSTAQGLDRAAVLRQIEQVMADHLSQFVSFHDLSAASDGPRLSVTFHLVMPAGASVGETHDFCDHIEADLARRLADARINIHVEPCDRHCGPCRALCDQRQTDSGNRTPNALDSSPGSSR